MSDRVASWVRQSEHLVVLTGAGISAESGISAFRGAGGLRRGYRAEDLATPEAFTGHPMVIWDWYPSRRGQIAEARPNRGHEVIVRLERSRPDFTLLAQNVDGLHQRAGSLAPLELHGNLWRVRCASGESFRCACGGRLRPSVVWFGESLDLEVLDVARRAEEQADVYPAAALPQLARRPAGKIVEINVEPTLLSADAHPVLRGTAGDALSALELRL